jgi:hypothetical protein
MISDAMRLLSSLEIQMAKVSKTQRPKPTCEIIERLDVCDAEQYGTRGCSNECWAHPAMYTVNVASYVVTFRSDVRRPNGGCRSRG